MAICDYDNGVCPDTDIECDDCDRSKGQSEGEKCPKCKGEGVISAFEGLGNKDGRCANCGGTGKVAGTDISNRQKCRLLEKAILELPTDRYDYVISVLEDKYEELKQSPTEARPQKSNDICMNGCDIYGSSGCAKMFPELELCPLWRYFNKPRDELPEWIVDGVCQKYKINRIAECNVNSTCEGCPYFPKGNKETKVKCPKCQSDDTVKRSGGQWWCNPCRSFFDMDKKEVK